MIKTFFQICVRRYPRLIGTATSGLFFSCLAFVVMGNLYGFSSLSPVAVIPGFVVGSIVGFIITHLVILNRNILIKRHKDELNAAISMQSMTTQKENAEKNAVAFEAQLLKIFSIAPEALILLDSDMNIQLFNKGAESVYGVIASKILGHSMRELMPERFRNDFQNRLAINTPTNEKEDALLHPNDIVGLRIDGTEFPGLASISKMDGIEGDTYIVLIRDVTADRKIDEQIRRSQKMDAVGQLTAGVAHDFNNILGIAMGNLELLRERLTDDVVSRNQADAALKAVCRGSAITSKLLGVSRNDVQNIQRVSLTPIIADIRNLIEKSMTAAINVEFDLADNTWDVALDPGDLEDALLNLSLNAKDAMPNGGTFRITTFNSEVDEEYARLNPESRVGHFTVITVSDTGSGMSHKVMEKILEPFYTTKDKDKGTGLGLSIVYGFVKRLGGFLEIDSEIGKGTEFKLYLPCADKQTGKICPNRLLSEAKEENHLH